jgi:hypothetical protein
VPGDGVAEADGTGDVALQHRREVEEEAIPFNQVPLTHHGASQGREEVRIFPFEVA